MEEDGTRNAAIASNPSVRSSAISVQQLTKFRELQRRRMQIQTKTKNKRKPKGKKEIIVNEDVDTQGCVDDLIVDDLKDSSFNTSSKAEDSNQVSSSTSLVNKRKLHWGLDVKQRWERKANM